MLREELKDPRIKGLLSITDVEVTNDLRFAKVYVSMLTDMNQSRDNLKVLEKAGGYLRTELAKRLQLRYTPELIFKLDQSIEYGSKINNILSGLNEKEGEPDSHE